jgi:hypothetical protein
MVRKDQANLTKMIQTHLLCAHNLDSDSESECIFFAVTVFVCAHRKFKQCNLKRRMRQIEKARCIHAQRASISNREYNIIVIIGPFAKHCKS